MALFNFGKKKEEENFCCGGSTAPAQEIKTDCSCTSKCSNTNVKKTRFIVLGACCQKSTDTFCNTKQAVAEMGFTDEVLNIGDASEIAKYGVMQTPALVVDNKVVSYGRLLKVEDVKKLITKIEAEQCPCPKKTCPNNGKCRSCVIKHKETDSLPFCLFLNNDGDKSVKHYYEKLKERFEAEKS